MTDLKLNLSNLRVDGGKVECTFTTPQGEEVPGAIEPSFFEDFMGQPDLQLSATHQRRIIADNEAWLAEEAERLLRLGHRTVTIS